MGNKATINNLNTQPIGCNLFKRFYSVLVCPYETATIDSYMDLGIGQ